jgi:hypothetical protein
LRKYVSVHYAWQLLLIFSIACLVVIASAKLIGAAVTISQLQQVDYGEPIVYGISARLVTGEPLYQPIDRPPYTAAAYPPLYYTLGGLAQAVCGPGFAAGRLLSTVAGLVTAALAARLTKQVGGTSVAACFAALAFVGLGFVGAMPWFALYRVDLLGIALSVAGVSVLSGGITKRRLIWGGVCAGLALLTKQTFFAAALAGTIWLLPFSRNKAALFAGTVCVVVLVPAACLEAATGAFVTNTVTANVNPLDFETFWSALVPTFRHYQHDRRALCIGSLTAHPDAARRVC